MASVLIQAGHAPNNGGAPGEAQWAARLAEKLGARLQAAGVEVTVVGDWFNRTPPPEAGRHYSLFISLHYDAAIYGARGDGRGNTGCFADRAVNDPVASLSDQAIREWERLYPRERGGAPIPLANDRRNPNTSQYYAFRATSARTPGIIVEHGCGAPVGTSGFPAGDDAAFLHGEIERVADLDARAVLRFLELTAGLRPVGGEASTETLDVPAPATAPPPTAVALSAEDAAILAAVKGLGGDAASVGAWISEIGALREENQRLRAELAAGAGAPPAGEARRVAHARFTFDDGTTQELGEPVRDLLAG
jgi:hypothetical protein